MNSLLRASLPSLSLVALLSVLCACSGGGGGSSPPLGGGSSPTDPEETYYLIAAGAMQNQSDRCCLQTVSVRLDGRALTTFSVSQGGGVVAWNINVGTAGQLVPVEIERGSHTLTVAVGDDPRAPSSYWAVGEIAIKDAANNVLLERELNRREGTLNEGQGFDWTFTF